MPSTRVRRLSLPAFALVFAILAATGLMLVTHLRALGRERERMASELRIQATVIVRTLESGARAGMMMRWGREHYQALLEEAVQLKEIAYVGIFDAEGKAVAAARATGEDPPWPGPGEVGRVIEEGEEHFAEHRIDGRGIFEVTRKFVPRVRRRQMGRMMVPGRGLHPANPPEEDPRWAVVLGLETGPWEEVLQEGRRQALLSLLVLAISGSIALYVGIVLQNYFVVRRTLGDMRAYAQKVLENMADGLISADGEGKVATYNAEALRILGRQGDNLEGEDLRTLLPEAAGLVESVLGRDRKAGEMEVVLERGAAGTTADLVVSPLLSEEGDVTGAVLLLRDLTEVRRLEKKVREAEKLAALGQMAATVAHEVRNPLSSLKGFARLFEKKFETDSSEAGYARLMVREVDRLNRTVSDLLFYSRPLELEREPVDVGGLLLDAVRLLEPDTLAAGQRMDLEGVGRVTVRADSDQLRRAFLNVLLNAHQAAGRGGTIAVSAEPLAGGGCRVEVGDSGPGMDPDDAARAFEPFFTTREKGSGLGLAIVRKIVELHDGRVSIGPGGRGGTAVVMELPP